MQDKIVVISGATSGIGEVAALDLAQKGVRIVAIARNIDRGEDLLGRLREIAPGPPHHIHYADLSRLSEMKRVGAEIAAREPRIDVLINNAGAIFQHRQLTEDGIEKTFALNHLNYFVLTRGLLPSLAQTPGARVVNTASSAHRRGVIDFSDLNMAHKYTFMGAYGRSKLANILFTRELARRVADKGITANCLHPGFVLTRFGANNGILMRIGVRIAMARAIPVEEGAKTMIYLASSPDVTGKSGGFYVEEKLATPSKAAQDDDVARRLWDVSEAMTGIKY
jgi:NAD(P)-dependent dehydrogenase (short-subunit alcohol dehydrogenase family)